jgi:Protein of unknown function (DUF2946)
VVTGVKSFGRLAVLPILLLALLLQADAIVRSLVMQAAPGIDGAQICSTRMEQTSGPGASHTMAAGHGTISHSRCPYCEVAGHVPVVVAPPPLPLATLVAFVAFERAVSHAPPVGAAIETRARGPPLPV